nr:hypothetical protein [Tanacetum cinerariifolium]
MSCFEVGRNEDGNPQYGSIAPSFLDIEDEIERALAMETYFNTFKNINVFKKLIDFLSTLPVPLKNNDWDPKDMMTIEYVHEDGDVSIVRGKMFLAMKNLFSRMFRLCGKEHVYTLPEFADLLGLYSESDVQHLLFETHFQRLMTNNTRFNREDNWSRMGQLRIGIKKLADIRMFGKALDRRANKLSPSTPLEAPPQANDVPRGEPSGLNLTDEANSAYPPYEPPNIPHYLYPYVPYVHPYTYYPNMGNLSHRGGQYRVPRDAYMFTSAMPSYGGNLIIPSSGYAVRSLSRGVQDDDEDDNMSD